MRHSPNVVAMLGHRPRRWPNIATTLSGDCQVNGLSPSAAVQPVGYFAAKGSN